MSKPRAAASRGQNIFQIVGVASAALRHAGLRDQIAAMQDRVSAARSYDEALRIVDEYVELEA